MKYLCINRTQYVQDLYTMNNKMPMKEIKEDINKDILGLEDSLLLKCQFFPSGSIPQKMGVPGKVSQLLQGASAPLSMGISCPCVSSAQSLICGFGNHLDASLQEDLAAFPRHLWIRHSV